jgi:hypothetical protein
VFRVISYVMDLMSDAFIGLERDGLKREEGIGN